MRSRTLWLCLLTLVAAAPGARAQGFIIPRRPPRPMPVPVQPLSVKSQKVTMQATNGALKVEVEQVFYNPNGFPVEGTYLFPLPEGAAVSNFRLQIDREPVDGKMLSVEEARRVYESYVRQNVDPAILEYVGRNAFQARVFPIPAGGERRIFLGYSQAAEFSNGIYKLAYPLTSERATGQVTGSLAVDCTIKSAQPIKAVYSPSHQIQVRRDDDRTARVSYEGQDGRADRDFVVYYTISEKDFGLNALAHRRAAEDGYVMLMLAPKREVKDAEVQPKDVVFVFDTSGSMQGDKIEQARKALKTMLDALHAQDRFNVIRFSTDVTTFREGVVPASAQNREAARRFVDEFKAVGGTNIDEALQTGIAALPKGEGGKQRAPFLIFMTDGLPTVGTQDVSQILQSADKAAPAELRLFSFGVGSDVNTLLLDRLARDNRGAADYIGPSEDLETRIGSFYAKIADPVLSNVKVTVDGAKLLDLYPNRIPDLFAGTQLLLLGRYQGTGKVKVRLSGELNGRPRDYEYELTLPERQMDHSFIPKLWAGRKIGFLLEEIRLRGENKELKDEVVRLSQEHGIVTPYTAYLVEEPGVQRFGRAGADVHLEGRQLTDLSRNFDSRLGAEVGQGGRGGQGQTSAGGVPGRAPSPTPLGLPGPAGPAGPARPAAKPAAPPAADTKSVNNRTEQEAVRFRQQAYGFSQSTGWNAVEASKRLRELKDKEVAESDVEVMRQVEGRVFRLQAGVWTEQAGKPAAKLDAAAGAKSEAKPVQIKYGSEAYFRLISANKEWARVLALGKKVTFRTGPRTLVTVGEEGKEKLSDAELKALSQ